MLAETAKGTLKTAELPSTTERQQAKGVHAGNTGPAASYSRATTGGSGGAAVAEARARGRRHGVREGGDVADSSDGDQQVGQSHKFLR